MRACDRWTDDELFVWPSSATSLLKQDYKETMTVKEATELCLKVMSKTMDTTKLGSEKRASPPSNPLLFSSCSDAYRN